MKSILKICVIVGLLSLPYTYAEAQTSFKEVEKQRLMEEKARAKAAKKVAKKKSVKKSSDVPTIDPFSDRKTIRKAQRKKAKGNVPNASRRLSTENRRVNQQRAENRKNAEGLTKAAKTQQKAARKR